MYSGLSAEKYNIMKPSKKDKSVNTIKRLRDYIGEKGNMCIISPVSYSCHVGVLRNMWQLCHMES